MNNLLKVVAQQRRSRASNPRLLDRKSDALPLSHRATPHAAMVCCFQDHDVINERIYLALDALQEVLQLSMTLCIDNVVCG